MPRWTLVKIAEGYFALSSRAACRTTIVVVKESGECVGGSKQADARGGTNESGAPPREFVAWVPSTGTGSPRRSARASRTPSRPHTGAPGHRPAGSERDFDRYAQSRA